MNQIIYFCATYLIYIASAYAFLHVILKHEQRHHIKHIAIIFGSGIMAWIIGHFLKNVIAHQRPDMANALLIPNDIYSFPAGHATFMFALAFSLYTFDKRAGTIIFILGIISGVSRVLAGVHYWYDIVGGFILGGLIAYIVVVSTKSFRS